MTAHSYAPVVKASTNIDCAARSEHCLARAPHWQRGHGSEIPSARKTWAPARTGSSERCSRRTTATRRPSKQLLPTLMPYCCGMLLYPRRSCRSASSASARLRISRLVGGRFTRLCPTRLLGVRPNLLPEGRDGPPGINQTRSTHLAATRCT